MEDRIRELLRDRAEDVPGYGQIPPSLKKRARRRTAVTVGTTLVTVVAVVVGSVIGVRSLSAPPTLPVAPTPTRAVAFHHNGGIVVEDLNGMVMLGRGSAQYLGPGRDLYRRVAWSPDGAKLAYSSTNNPDPDRGLYVLDLSTRIAQKISPCRSSSCISGGIDWSPDGTHIAFAEGGELYLTNADGTGTTTLADLGARFNLSGPTWSPDGKRVAVAAAVQGRSLLEVIDVARSNATVLLDQPSLRAVDPDWSPDGTQIAFLSFPPLPGRLIPSIWTMNADGSASPTKLIQELPCAVCNIGGPVWSPDGTQIAFTAVSYGGGHELSVMRADGTDVKILNRDVHGQPAWRPVP